MSVAPIEKLLEKITSKYKLVTIAARRALELNDGATRLVDVPSKTKPALVALQEIIAGKITYRVRKPAKG